MSDYGYCSGGSLLFGSAGVIPTDLVGCTPLTTLLLLLLWHTIFCLQSFCFFFVFFVPLYFVFPCSVAVSDLFIYLSAQHARSRSVLWLSFLLVHQPSVHCISDQNCWIYPRSLVWRTSSRSDNIIDCLSDRTWHDSSIWQECMGNEWVFYIVYLSLVNAYSPIMVCWTWVWRERNQIKINKTRGQRKNSSMQIVSHPDLKSNEGPTTSPAISTAAHAMRYIRV
jgi:hypothetical protein